MHGCFLSCTEDSWRKIIFTCWATILQLHLNSDNAPECLIWVKVGPKHSFVVCVMHNVTWTTIEINRAVSFQNCNCTQLSHRTPNDDMQLFVVMKSSSAVPPFETHNVKKACLHFFEVDIKNLHCKWIDFVHSIIVRTIHSQGKWRLLHLCYQSISRKKGTIETKSQ